MAIREVSLMLRDLTEDLHADQILEGTKPLIENSEHA
jgi:hypothetical protein